MLSTVPGRTRSTGRLIDSEYIASHFHKIGELGIPDLESFRLASIAIQRERNPVYKRFDGFTYLPVQAFKRKPVVSFPVEEAEAVFISSGTAKTASRSRHYVKHLDVYHRSVVNHFRAVHGGGKRVILAHLPSYIESRGTSSLVTMVQILIDEFGLPGSQFFLDVMPPELVLSSGPVLLFGAAFGLIVLAESGSFQLPDDALIIETGGMKAHGREMSRADLHTELAHGFGIGRTQVTSEYGMCELLSQFYMRDNGLFYPPPWVSFVILDPADARTPLPEGETGALAIFDAANIYSVSSILTQDKAIRRGSGVDLLGRFSGAELRGCNFLVEERIGTSSD